MIEFFNLLGKMLESGFTWAAIVAALSTLEKYYDKRQSRKMLYLIAKKVGVEWDTPQEELKKMAQLSYKKFYSLSHKGTKHQKRRMIMERLKSRKLWITIVSAVLLVIKEGLDIPVDSETVLAFAGIVITAILGLAHVDAKRAEVTKNAEFKTPVEPTE